MAPSSSPAPDARTWFVTGSSRGLGRAITEAALAAGHRVTVAARTPSHLDDLVERYGAGRIRAVRLDVTNGDAARSAAAEAAEAFGRLDVAVNNAGYADLGAIEDISDDSGRRSTRTSTASTTSARRPCRSSAPRVRGTSSRSPPAAAGSPRPD